MILLEELSAGDEILLLGRRYLVTNKSQEYRIGCKDEKGFIHYFKRKTPIRKYVKHLRNTK